ncbi:MAG: hypothetical protein ABFD89_04030 [Bryobacteraceae bacterium]
MKSVRAASTQLASVGSVDLRNFRTAVSLHGHTMHSEESLAPLPKYVRRIPVVRSLFHALEKRYEGATGRQFDYARAFWTPPLSALESLALEQGQIENDLGLAALVSLTDHDNIHAGMRLGALESAREIPVSLEWTIPQPRSFLHVGVHNLPASQAREWVREMNSFTRCPSNERLQQILTGLNESRETLIVLNHPLWDEPRIGAQAHFRMVLEFLLQCGGRIHALEINGLRSPAENRAVARLAEELNLPVVSGGDRHGSMANTALNLTNAATFSEFVAEVREDGRSTVLLMPEYEGPHGLRYVECALDIIREYPELPGRSNWMDRAFIREEDGTVTPLSAYWGRSGFSPGAWPLSLTRLFHSGPLRSAVRTALAVYQESPL